MGRPQVIRDDEILSAARAVFLERGIRATTAQVAKRARISPGSLFNRFKSKEELFFAAMSQGGPPVWLAALETRRPRADLEADLLEVALSAAEYFRSIVPLAMMMWSSGCDGSRRQARARISRRSIELLAAYFGRAQREGRMRRDLDAHTAAHLFAGSLHSFAVFEHLMDDTKFRASEDKLVEFVRLFVVGAGVTRTQSRAPRTAKKAAVTRRTKKK